jgi:hypothetical protein
VVAALSPYLVNRHLRTLASWLSEGGRLALVTIPGSFQIALSQRAALRGGLALHSSIYEDGRSMLTFLRPKQRDVEVWEWAPGEWLRELSEEDKLILERLANDRKAAGDPGDDGPVADALEPTQEDGTEGVSDGGTSDAGTRPTAEPQGSVPLEASSVPKRPRGRPRKGSKPGASHWDATAWPGTE